MYTDLVVFFYYCSQILVFMLNDCIVDATSPDILLKNFQLHNKEQSACYMN